VTFLLDSAAYWLPAVNPSKTYSRILPSISLAARYHLGHSDITPNGYPATLAGSETFSKTVE
jgi:hypothetical protein